MRWRKSEPLFDGEESSKQPILDMYKNTPCMDAVIENEKLYMKKLSPGMLFGEEGKKLYFEKRKIHHNV